MKKLILLGLMAFCIIMAGCQMDKDISDTPKSKTETVKITIPSELALQHAIDSQLEALNLRERLETDPDGTQNISLTKEEQQTLLNGVKEEVDSFIKELHEDNLNNYISEVSYDESMETFTIHINKDMWSEDTSASVCFFTYGDLYQTINRKDAEDIVTSVKFIEDGTDNILGEETSKEK